MSVALFALLPSLTVLFLVIGLHAKFTENKVEAALKIRKRRHPGQQPLIEIVIAKLVGSEGSLIVEKHNFYSVAYFGALVFGIAGYLISGIAVGLMFSIIGLAVVPRLYRKRRLRRIRNDFVNQLGYASDAMVNAMVGGSTRLEAFEYTARQMKGEVSSEFEKIAEDIRSNIGLDVSLEKMAERVDMEEVYDFADSLSLLHEAEGGEKAISLLRSASKFIKEKSLIREKVAAYTSNIRFGYITAIIVVLLIAVFLYSVMPEYRWVYSRPEGKIVALAAMLIIGFGYWMVRNMINNSEKRI